MLTRACAICAPSGSGRRRSSGNWPPMPDRYSVSPAQTPAEYGPSGAGSEPCGGCTTEMPARSPYAMQPISTAAFRGNPAASTVVRAGTLLGEEAAVRLVHPGVVVHAGQVHVAFDQVPIVHAGGAQDGADVLHRLTRLRTDACQQFTGLRVAAKLPREKQAVAGLHARRIGPGNWNSRGCDHAAGAAATHPASAAAAHGRQPRPARDTTTATTHRRIASTHRHLRSATAWCGGGLTWVRARG